MGVDIYGKLTNNSAAVFPAKWYPTRGDREKYVDVRVELDENSELARLIASSDRNKYDTIRRYLIENFGGRELELSDGKKAVIDKSDAKELAHKADNKRTAEIAELEAIIKKHAF